MYASLGLLDWGSGVQTPDVGIYELSLPLSLSFPFFISSTFLLLLLAILAHFTITIPSLSHMLSHSLLLFLDNFYIPAFLFSCFLAFTHTHSSVLQHGCNIITSNLVLLVVSLVLVQIQIRRRTMVMNHDSNRSARWTRTATNTNDADPGRIQDSLAL